MKRLVAMRGWESKVGVLLLAGSLVVFVLVLAMTTMNRVHSEVAASSSSFVPPGDLTKRSGSTKLANRVVEKNFHQQLEEIVLLARKLDNKLHSSLRVLSEVEVDGDDEGDADASSNRNELPAAANAQRNAGGSHRRKKPSNYPLLSAESFATDSIFVSVSSFRDAECGPMVKDMYEKAHRPERIFVGIVEQHAPEDPPCFTFDIFNCQHNTFCPSDNIRIRRFGPELARGPTFGRFITSLLYRGQAYFLMLDSHNIFAPGWDDIVIKMYRSLPTTKGVLSHYPEAYEPPSASTGSSTQAVPTAPDHRFARPSTTAFLCKARFLPHLGYLRFDANVVAMPAHPIRSPFAAAGFLFANASLLHDVPFDPHLDLLFDGEEILFSTRMWTHGWDIFSPSQNIVLHHYGRAKAPKVWDAIRDWPVRQQAAQRRVQYILHAFKTNLAEPLVPDDTTEEAVLVDLDTYGLGKERTLEEYYRFAGVDPIRYEVKKDWCQLNLA